MTDDGAINIALSDDMPARFRAQRLARAGGRRPRRRRRSPPPSPLAKADPRPSMIACTTVIGRGIAGGRGARARRTAAASSRRTPTRARQYLDWPHPPFEIPEDILAAWREAGRRSLPDYEAWQARVAALEPGQAPRRSTACARAACRRAGSGRCAPSSAAPRRRGTPSHGYQDLGRHRRPSGRGDPGADLRRAGPGGRHAAQARAWPPSPRRTTAGATSITASAST